MPDARLRGIGALLWLLALEGSARRWLRNVRPWAATVLVNATIMTLFLWHATSLVLLVGLANWLGGIGLGFEPGSAAWWTARPLWFAACAALLVPFALAFGRFEQGSRAEAASALPAWQALAGAVAVCGGLAVLALGGIGAPGPIGIRVWTVLVVLAGARLATGPPLRRAALAS